MYLSFVPVNHQVLLRSILQRQQLGQTQLTTRCRLQQIGIDSCVPWAYRQHVTVKGYRRAQHVVNVGFKAMICGFMNGNY